VAKDPRLKVCNAAVGVDQLTIGGACDGVDGEVAAQQVFLKADLGRSVAHEAGVAATALALGARERVFLLCLRVEKNREVPPHRAEPPREHGFRGFTDHHPVAILDRKAEQCVANRTAHHKGTHQS